MGTTIEACCMNEGDQRVPYQMQAPFPIKERLLYFDDLEDQPAQGQQPPTRVDAGRDWQLYQQDFKPNNQSDEEIRDAYRQLMYKDAQVEFFELVFSELMEEIEFKFP